MAYCQLVIFTSVWTPTAPVICIQAFQELNPLWGMIDHQVAAPDRSAAIMTQSVSIVCCLLQTYHTTALIHHSQECWDCTKKVSGIPLHSLKKGYICSDKICVYYVFYEVNLCNGNRGVLVCWNFDVVIMQ